MALLLLQKKDASRYESQGLGMVLFFHVLSWERLSVSTSPF